MSRSRHICGRPLAGSIGQGEVAVYLADQADTAWAEWYRALAARGVEPTDEVPRDLWQVSVDLEEVVDLRSAALRAVAGVPARIRPADTQWRAFQEFAAAMRDQGAQGILYASAARTRSLCLCVFEAGLSGLSVQDPPVRVLSPPPPPRGLRT
ncbi:MAG TPA: RES domain-containing protein [Solirubrobacteraceae bacterium]|nr:RES domain-containing protein [Solirubrobacteraceae bacterium]